MWPRDQGLVQVSSGGGFGVGEIFYYKSCCKPRVLAWVIDESFGGGFEKGCGRWVPKGGMYERYIVLVGLGLGIGAN